MGAERATQWGPAGLSQVLADQLTQHGFVGPDAATACAEQLASSVGPAARASLFVDLGACKFLDGDVAAAIASWRQAVVSGQVAPASRALFNLGLLHDHVQLFDQAIELFESAIAHGVEPYASLATLAMARSDRAAGNESRAMATMARLADALMLQVPENSLLGETLLGLGEVAEEAGQMDRAAQAYRAASSSEDDRVRDEAVFALVRVLRFIGHDEEAHELVESSGIADADPAVVIDRVELLTRLGRIDEALVLSRDVETEGLSVHDRFRHVGLQLDLGLVNEAIDGLEVLGNFDAAETRARAAFSLGEVYLTHDMGDPALSMFEAVCTIDNGYWADKASLVLGDLAMGRGDNRTAAARWADAAGSRVVSISSVARERLVEAVEVAAELDSVETETTSGSIDLPTPVPAVAIIMGDSDGGANIVDDGYVTDVPTQAVDISLYDGSLYDGSDALAASAAESSAESTVEPALSQSRVTESAAAPVDVVPEPSAPIIVALRRRSAGPNEARVDSKPTIAEADATEPQGSAASGPVPVVIPLGGPRSTSPTPTTSHVADNPLTSAAPINAAPINNVPTATAPTIDLRQDVVANPYASLAPEALRDDPVPSDRNPYAELAPNFGGDPTSTPRPIEDNGLENNGSENNEPESGSGDDVNPFSQFT